MPTCDTFHTLRRITLAAERVGLALRTRDASTRGRRHCKSPELANGTLGALRSFTRTRRSIVIARSAIDARRLGDLLRCATVLAGLARRACRRACGTPVALGTDFALRCFQLVGEPACATRGTAYLFGQVLEFAVTTERTGRLAFDVRVLPRRAVDTRFPPRGVRESSLGTWRARRVVF